MRSADFASCFRPLAVGLVILFGSVSAAARGEVVQSDAAGFELQLEALVPSSPDDSYATLIDIARWWNPAHTYSGDSANLSLRAQAGGCWCESLPGGGSVEHLRVVYVQPGRLLRLRGALGPLQQLPVDGILSWQIHAAEGSGQTRISVNYRVFGHAATRLDAWAEAVEGVLAEQLERLRLQLDSGPPAADGAA